MAKMSFDKISVNTPVPLEEQAPVLILNEEQLFEPQIQYVDKIEFVDREVIVKVRDDEQDEQIQNLKEDMEKALDELHERIDSLPQPKESGCSCKCQKYDDKLLKFEIERLERGIKNQDENFKFIHKMLERKAFKRDLNWVKIAAGASLLLMLIKNFF